MNSATSLRPASLPVLLCFSHLRWNFVYQRPQHLMSRFARYYRVLYFEEPVFDAPHTAWLEVREEPGGVSVLVPHLPASRQAGQPADEFAQRQLLDGFLVHTGPHIDLLWYYTPMSLSISEHLDAGYTVYDCMDELSAFRGASPLLVDYEKKLLARADVVFTGGYSLFEAKRSQHANVHLFPSSVDLKHFAKARAPLPEPADQQGIAHPRLGFHEATLQTQGAEMENETKVGMNRTGIQMAPVQGPTQIEYARDTPPHPDEGSEQNIARMRGLYVKEADRVGSVPIPATGRGLAETAIGKLKGGSPEVLFDKLGERAAFERSGVRLYQAMISKVQATSHAEQQALLADLTHICEEEFQHFQMLSNMIEEMGGDSTAQTPCADISAVAAMGLIQVITDPRTTLAQGLQALLTAEMTDNACWELLIELARDTGHDNLVEPCQQALASEQEHEAMIKQWLRKMVMEEAT